MVMYDSDIHIYSSNGNLNGLNELIADGAANVSGASGGFHYTPKTLNVNIICNKM